jgi:proteasome lid subunit RPN8/RPN11
MLQLSPGAYSDLVAHAFDCWPLEACGLLVGVPFSASEPAFVVEFHPTDNISRSAKVYAVDPRGHLRAQHDADDRGLEIIGVMHSHTHTSAYPSPTDVAQAPDPGWHYLIVSLAAPEAVTRSYSLVNGKIAEEPVVVEGR